MTTLQQRELEKSERESKKKEKKAKGKGDKRKLSGKDLADLAGKMIRLLYWKSGV